jgi:hypothetical protein
LLEHAHENDVLPEEKRDQGRIPLMFYDWRGQEVNGKRETPPAAVKQIEEIDDWFREYILGEDFSAEQETALGIQPIDSLHEAFTKEKLDIQAASGVRKLFREKVLPGAEFFLKNFTPYRKYVQELRSVEAEYCKKSDIARHAFHYLRFGSHRGGADIDTQVRQVYAEISNDFEEAKEKIPNLLRLDIGMRGVIYAFAACRPFYQKSLFKTVSWLEYAPWFTDQINSVYEDGWFSAKSGGRHDLLLHLTYDHNNTVQNYRLDQAEDALGGFLVLLSSRYGLAASKVPTDQVWATIWDEYSDKLASTITKGYRRQVRVLLKEQYPNGGKELNQAVKKQALERVEEHMDKIEKALLKIK